MLALLPNLLHGQITNPRGKSWKNGHFLQYFELLKLFHNFFHVFFAPIDRSRKITFTIKCWPCFQTCFMVKLGAHEENHEKMSIFGRISSFWNCSTTFIPLFFVFSDRDRAVTSTIKVWLCFRTGFRIISATNDPIDWKWAVLDPLFGHYLSDSALFLNLMVRFVQSLTFRIV